MKKRVLAVLVAVSMLLSLTNTAVSSEQGYVNVPINNPQEDELYVYEINLINHGRLLDLSIPEGRTWLCFIEPLIADERNTHLLWKE
jgi:hypothetical protein